MRFDAHCNLIAVIVLLIAPQEHHMEWKKQNEGTASAQDSLGFKDHKAAIHDLNMAAVDQLLQAIPCETGFSPKGHCNIVDYQMLHAWP